MSATKTSSVVAGNVCLREVAKLATTAGRRREAARRSWGHERTFRYRVEDASKRPFSRRLHQLMEAVNRALGIHVIYSGKAAANASIATRIFDGKYGVCSQST